MAKSPKKKAEIVPDPEATAAADRAEAQTALEWVRTSVPVTSAEERVAAVKMIADLKDQREAIVERWTSFLEPIKESIEMAKLAMSRIDAFFGPPVAAMDEAEAVLKQRIILLEESFAIQRDELIHEAGKLGAAGDSAAAGDLVARASEKELAKVPGLSTTTKWTGEVEDAALIPREYMTPDVKLLKAKTTSVNGNPKIPGWKAYPVSTAAVTRARVER